MEGTFLVLVDADRIQEYIFSPTQLKLIRGASAIQRDINLKHTLELLRESSYGAGNIDADNQILPRSLAEHPDQMWEVVYAGGGNVYALFRQETAAEDAAQAICRLYRKHGGTASATAAVVPWVATFRDTLDMGQAKLMVRKTAITGVADPISSPYWKVCEACGSGPAAHWTQNPTTGERMLCSACEARRGQSDRALHLHEIRSDLKPPKDFEVIAEASHPENYLALVYIDVDRLGRYFDDIAALTPETYREHSLRIRDTVQAGVIAGCKAACEGTAAGSTAPCEVLLLGGDDAIVALSAQSAFRYLEAFREAFKKEFTNLTFSAGVVWAHHHLPIAQFVHQAGRLLRSAKAAGGGRVDYLVVSESMIRERSAEATKRTLRPYELGAFAGLGETIRLWKMAGFPGGKVHQLYGMAYEEESQGTLDFLYWLSRLEEGHRTAARSYFANGFWQRTPHRATAAADLAELWDFVEAR